jgi:hypothetical protein
MDPFLGRIVPGKQPYSILRATFDPEPPNVTLRQVNYSNVCEVLADKSSIRMFLMASAICPKYRRL